MDLHVALAVAILRHGFAHRGRQRRTSEQPAVKLVRRDRADHAPPRFDLLAAREPHAARGALIVEQDARDVGAGEKFAALVADQALERIERVLGAAFDDRRAGGFERERDHLRHLAGIGGFGPEPGMQHPRREQRAHDFGLEPRLEPAARGAERFAEESREPAQAAAPGFARHDLRHRARPQRAAEQREQKRRVGADAADVGIEPRAVAAREPFERGDVGLMVHVQDRVAAVGQQHRSRRRRVCEGKTALFQIGGELGVSGRRQEQHEGRRHDVVDEARRGDLFGADTAADAVVALDDEDLMAPAAQQGRRHQRIDAASDDDVVGSHALVPPVAVITGTEARRFLIHLSPWGRGRRPPTLSGGARVRGLRRWACF